MQVSQDWIANIAVLNEILRKETWYNTFWAKYAGFVDVSIDDNGNKKYQPSGNPIEILKDNITEGRDNILIPFLNRLTGDRVMGDTVLKGTGEELSMKWLRAYVNQWRKAVIKKSGNMSELRSKIYKLYEEALPQLRRYFAEMENQDVFQAFYEGVSPNLSAATADDGLALDKRYHPNSYYHAGSGTITKMATTEGQTPTAANIDSAVSSASAMDTDALKALRVKCMNLRIPQMETKSGEKYWVLIVHPQTHSKLQNDSDYVNAQRYAYMGTSDVPEFSGVAGYYAGFAIFEDIVGIRGWDTTNDDFFGSDTSERIAPTDVTDNYCSLVVGNSAMGKAISTDLHFTYEIDDHENTIEIGGAVTNGYNRSDFAAEADAGETSGDLFDKGSTGGGVASGIAVTNQSSLIFMTDDE